MRYLVPMLVLVGVVLLMGSFNGEGFRAARGVLFGIGLLGLLVVIFAVIVAQVT